MRGVRREQDGFALIAVLLVLSFVAVIGAEFAYSMRLEASAARVYKESLIATHLAEAGIEQATRELVADFAFVTLGDAKDPGTDPACPLVFYTSAKTLIKRLPHQNVPLGGGQFTYCITDEDSRLNLNGNLAGDRFSKLLEALGVERADRDTISDSLLDWRDANEEHRLNGAESEDTYLKLATPYRSKNGNLDSVAELIQVKGITATLMEGVEGRTGLADVVTVWGSGQLNANTVRPEVLRALLVSEAEITANDQRRAQDPTSPSRIQGRGIGLALTSRTFRIEATGLIDGQVRARLTAIVRKGTATGADGLTVLEWSGVR
jgi:general secretion pathway protein K